MPTIAVSRSESTPPRWEADPIAPERRSRSVHVDERVLAQVRGSRPGPLLICVAALHGNEPAGVVALRRVFAQLAGVAEAAREGAAGHATDGPPRQRALPAGRHHALCGDAVALVGNLGALAAGRRFLREDLNRIWLAPRLARVRSAPQQGDAAPQAEEAELAGLDAALERAVAAARGPVHVLDLHTTSGDGAPFGLLEDTLENRRLAFRLPVPLILGLEEELVGTLTNHLAARGLVTVGFEAGQHDDPASAERAEDAIWLALDGAGILEPGGWPEVDRARLRLATASGRLPPVLELRYRHPITAHDEFRMAPGFHNFEPVEKGQTLAWDRRGPVLAPARGLLLMPLYQKLGEDGFFLVRRVRPLWLKLSAVVRRLGLERALHLLPGVRRDPQAAGGYLVDRRVARWSALQLFHLLGFHRRGPAGRWLVMSRRPER